jgi:hypothetical protein
MEAGACYGPPATEPVTTIIKASKSIFPLSTKSCESLTFSECGLSAACRFNSPTIASFSFSSKTDAKSVSSEGLESTPDFRRAVSSSLHYFIDGAHDVVRRGLVHHVAGPTHTVEGTVT